MTTRRTSTFYRGERVTDLRPKLRSLADAANRDLSPGAGSAIPSGLIRDFTAFLEIKTLDLTDKRLRCVIPGLAADPDAFEYYVYPPPLLHTDARSGIAYTYTSLNERTADDTVTTETQFLRPAYLVGDIIFCQLALFVDDNPVYDWYDVNIDARAWLADPT